MAMDEKGQEAIVIHWRLDAWFPELGENLLQKFKIYSEHLMKLNKTVNLISPKSYSASDQLNFSDAILASRVIFAAEANLSQIYDFGSGNGFPGIVFALLYPKVSVVLVDSNKRKVEALRLIVETLGVLNVSILEKSVESLPEGSVDVAFARGFLTISSAILLARKIVPKGGRFYHLKGEVWANEVSGIPTQLCSVWTPSLTGEYKLPVGNVKYAVILTEKIS